MAIVGSARGDDEIEYCRIRMGGSMARKSPSGRAADGYSSNMSRGERRLARISFSKSLPANAKILALTASSDAHAAIRAMFYRNQSLIPSLGAFEHTFRVAG